jgi:hypothetical protein
MHIGLAKIFPVEESLRALRAAAWGAFLAFTRPHLETFNVLRSEYSRAVDFLGSSPSGRWLSAHPDERLAEHLMVLYWWGTLDLEGADNLLPRFFINASGDLRARALDYVGISLHRTGDVPPQTLNRLQELWNHRLHPPYGEPSLSAKEAAAFGWWFASAKFDDAWSMKQLKEALSRTDDVEAYDLVLERLAVLSEEMPADAAECLKLMLKRDAGGWRIFTFREVQRRILRSALQGGDPTARVIAEDLINWLGARGQWDLGDLLREVENGTTR